MENRHYFITYLQNHILTITNNPETRPGIDGICRYILNFISATEEERILAGQQQQIGGKKSTTKKSTTKKSTTKKSSTKKSTTKKSTTKKSSTKKSTTKKSTTKKSSTKKSTTKKSSTKK